MTATFGKLDGDTLRLEPGMNWIVAPNEWGKSTWCAFLVAMFYGIDTRERSGKDTLAVKERYAPWSGKPMEGLIRLEYQGRDITIARRTKGRAPLGQFAAFETQTGLPIRELTADNCGQILLGVEKSVFQRSGFITLKEMPVTADEALRRRLNALVTTADESGEGDKLAEKLKELKNRCRYNRTGLIPECRDRLEELKDQLRQRQALDTQLAAAQKREAECVRELEQLECHQSWLDHRRGQSAGQRLQQALDADAAAGKRLEEKTKESRSWLPRQELEARLLVQEQAVRPRKAGWIFLLLAVLALTVAGGCALYERWEVAAAALAVMLALAVIGVIQQLRCSRAEKKMEQRLHQREQWLKELSAWDELERCRMEAEQARTVVRTLRGVTQAVPKPEQPDPMELDEEQTRLAFAQAQERLRQLRQLRGEALGRMERLPQVQAIEQQIDQTRRRLGELERTYTALGYAQKALEEAIQALQRRFAPRIICRAEEFLSRLTRGRYTELQLSQELKLTVTAADEVAGRSCLWRSDGTADQMYLALRLAVWEALMNGGPLVIDDALVRFDKHRLDAAAALLEELAKEHQILVFSCR